VLGLTLRAALPELELLAFHQTRMLQPDRFSKQERHDSRRWLREHGHALPSRYLR
jgi:hypothetical protein